MNIGLIGLGRMGSALAQRLADNKLNVVAFDRNAGQHDAIKRPIARAKCPAEIVAASDIIISIITDDSAVRSLFLGPDGLLSAKAGGKLFIEMSTIQPMTVQSIASAVEQHGARLIDAPVLGSVPSARAGTLVALVGGREEDVDRSRIVLELLTKRLVHLGPTGCGHAMKLAVNLTMAAYLQSLAEGLAIGGRYGVNINTMLGILSEAPTANTWLASKLAVLGGGHSDTTLDIGTLRKDVMCAVATGTHAGIPMPAASAILASLSAAVANGHAGSDIGELPRFFREFMLQSIPR